MFFSFESKAVVVFLMLTQLLILTLSQERTFIGLGPYLYMALPYIALNLSFLYLFEGDISRLLTVFSVGLLSFGVVYSLSARSPPYLMPLAPKVGFFVVIGCITCMILFCLQLLLHLKIVLPVVLAINLSVRPVLELIFVGSLFVVLMYGHRLFVVMGLILIAAYLVAGAYLSVDLSRFSFLQYIFLAMVAFYQRLSPAVSKAINWFPAALMFLGAISLAAYVFLSGLVSGGDSLLYLNALQAIERTDFSERWHPFMPIHNGVFILIPDALWPMEKLKGYSTSGWYLLEVMGVSPQSYPWGVGITSFASGYLYGGIYGVIVLFCCYGLVAAFFRTIAVNPFMVGVVIIFNIKLMFAMFRMDETMLLGAFFVSFSLFMFLRATLFKYFTRYLYFNGAVRA